MTIIIESIEQIIRQYECEKERERERGEREDDELNKDAHRQPRDRLRLAPNESVSEQRQPPPKQEQANLFLGQFFFGVPLLKTNLFLIEEEEKSVYLKFSKPSIKKKWQCK